IAEEHYSHFDALLGAEMVPLDLGGLVVPVVTPFDAELKIDEKALIAHLEFLASHGVARIMVNGTAAEFFSLLPEERKLLLTIATRYFPGLIFFNTSSDSLAQAKLAAHWAEDYGADAIIAMPPYYYADAAEQKLVDFFNELAESVELPMLLYNFVKHTNNVITPEIARQVKQIGIKDSSNNHSLIDATDHYFAGTSRSVVEGYQAGACGFVCAQANHIPGLYVELEKLLCAGDMESAKRLQEEIREVCATVSLPNEIAAIKMRLAEIIPSYSSATRLPL
ncbi:MAG: dihydrodipicolinate synthase family protein, partial [Kiritimatiellae bacterium]|nr:dihydrodipicolinate synthase family protein [Kiritimatiellia bacterium]